MTLEEKKRENIDLFSSCLHTASKLTQWINLENKGYSYQHKVCTLLKVSTLYACRIWYSECIVLKRTDDKSNCLPICMLAKGKKR